MAGKAKTPAPIDRPISRAYLRQFTGWSTAYPPGVSEPTSLRLMENVQINREGSVRIRPGLRYLSYDNSAGTTPLLPQRTVVGGFEAFFLDDGSKAYLFAALVDDIALHPDPMVDFLVAKPGLPLEVVPAHDIFTMVDADISFTAATTYVHYVQIDNKIVAFSNAGETARIFNVGATKTAVAPAELPGPIKDPGGGAIQLLPGGGTSDPVDIDQDVLGPPPTLLTPNNAFIIDPDQDFEPADATVGASNLLSSDQYTAADGDYRMEVFYTYSNEFGESVASRVATRILKRGWDQWLKCSSSAGDVPDETQPVDNPRNACDQIVVKIPTYVHDANLDAGATHLNIYATSYHIQDPRPVSAILVDSHEITGLTWAQGGGWGRVLAGVPAFSVTAPMPNSTNRHNYSVPPTGGQAIVAADRLVCVYDPVSPAVIRWTSNQPGRYLNFTNTWGGGYKTLTSGNMQVPACVKLWQNPQSVDTLTILCRGEDGRSTGYYMAPAQVAQQSEATNFMGFEETTATPGTVSPWGCEVANNALYHPLDEQLMKSTASNYNINHKSMTDTIADQWVALEDKVQITSTVHDNRIYYLVHNPNGEALETGCRGNEIWVLDIQAKTPTWSRWLVQGCALRTINDGGKVYVCVVRPDGFFVLDEERSYDEYILADRSAMATRNIPWLLESNTQGANRAHDAWCRLVQLNLVVGFFQGQMKYGVRGLDRNGQAVDKFKIIRDDGAPGTEAWDFEDYLQIQREMKEWFFYAESTETGGVVQASAGQISLVQYRYTPISVNVGYAYGSVETFEYGMAGNAEADRTTVNGIPMPYIDTGRP